MISRALVFAVACVVCGVGYPAKAAAAEPVSADSGAWTRDEWLRVAQGLVADPGSIPRLDNARSRALFEKFVSTKAWLTFDGNDFNGATRDFGSYKAVLDKLAFVLAEKRANNELLLLATFGLDVERAFLRLSNDFMARLSVEQRTSARRYACWVPLRSSSV